MAKSFAKKRKAAAPRWSQNTDSYAGWTLAGAVAVFVLALLFVGLHWQLAALIAVIATVLMTYVSIALFVVSVIPKVRLKPGLVLDVVAYYEAMLSTAMDAHRAVRGKDVWRAAVRALEGRSRVMQQWRVFAGSFVAILLSLYLATKAPECALATPFDLFGWALGNVVIDSEACRIRASIGALLLGGIMGLIFLQVAISILLDATMVAQHVSELCDESQNTA